MKRFILAIMFILVPVMAFGVGTVVQTETWITDPQSGEMTGLVVKLACTGDAAAATIPNTDLTGNKYKGLYLYEVKAYPQLAATCTAADAPYDCCTGAGAGCTAPDAADVLLYMDGMDLLGSVDNGTTPYSGANLISATLKQTTLPSMYKAGLGTHSDYFWMVNSTITLDVDNQATNDATYVIELKFVK